MLVQIESTPQKVGAAIGQEICQLLQQKPHAVLCLAAGHTSLETFDYLVEQKNTGRCDFSKVRLVELDEWVGMGEHSESCTGFLRRHLFSRLGLDSRQIFLFDAQSRDLPAECLRMERLVKELGGIDLMLLGIGLNGHLGLNEPGCSFEEGPHTTPLSETTKRVCQKYFSSHADLQQGITLGIRDIINSRRVVLAATGSHKAEIVARLLSEEVGPHLPATVLRNHQNSILYLDTAAAQLVQETDGMVSRMEGKGKPAEKTLPAKAH